MVTMVVIKRRVMVVVRGRHNILINQAAAVETGTEVELHDNGPLFSEGDIIFVLETYLRWIPRPMDANFFKSFITFCLSLPNIEVRPSVEEVQKMLCQVNLFKSGSILAKLTLFKRGNICTKSKLHRSARPSSLCARGLPSGRVWVSRPSRPCSRRWSRSWPGRWG